MATTIQSRRGRVSSSIAVKAPCVVATNAPITLNGEQTVNSVAVTDGDRVLVKDQADASENGVYYVTTSDWVRDVDFNSGDDIVYGTIVPISEGNWYELTTNVDTFTIGTTNLNFAVINIVPIGIDAATALARANTAIGLAIIGL